AAVVLQRAEQRVASDQVVGGGGKVAGEVVRVTVPGDNAVVQGRWEQLTRVGDAATVLDLSRSKDIAGNGAIGHDKVGTLALTIEGVAVVNSASKSSAAEGVAVSQRGVARDCAIRDRHRGRGTLHFVGDAAPPPARVVGDSAAVQCGSTIKVENAA